MLSENILQYNKLKGVEYQNETILLKSERIHFENYERYNELHNHVIEQSKMTGSTFTQGYSPNYFEFKINKLQKVALLGRSNLFVRSPSYSGIYNYVH